MADFDHWQAKKKKNSSKIIHLQQMKQRTTMVINNSLTSNRVFLIYFYMITFSTTLENIGSVLSPCG